MNKRFLGGLLATTMLVSPAYAINTAGGTGDVPVHLTQEATQFSVTVPTVLPVDVSATGVITVANDNKIINHSFGPVEVKSVSVESLKDWKLVDFNTDFKTKKVGLHEYGFQMNQANVEPTGSCAAVFDVIPGNGQISFVYDSKVAVQNMALDKENIANVVFTVGWSGGEVTPEKPQLNATHKPDKAKMDAVLQDLTGKITFTTTAYSGSDGVDISENGDGSVMAVVNGPDATVYADGGVLGVNDGNHMTGMFRGYGMTEIDLHGLDMSKMTRTDDMFCGCTALTMLDLSGVNMSQVTNAGFMFSECTSLTTLDLSGVNMSQVTHVGEMFQNCTALTTIDLSGVDMSQLTEPCSMFYDCSSLSTLNLSGINMGQVTDVSFMFYGCSALTTLDLSDIDMSQVMNTGYMFDSCTALKTCYARTQADCDELNSSINKSSNVNFIVKPKN